MKAPLVSVILIVKNGERFLTEAIQSVFDSDYRNFELIVVDGQSTDSTAKIAHSFREVRYFVQPNEGVSNAYNFGIEMAKGEFLAFISHDDLWLPQKLRCQIEHLLQNQEVQYTITKFKYFLQEGCSIPPGFKPELLNQELVGRFMETLVVRKTLFDQIGKFDPAYRIAGDVDWYARAENHSVPMTLIPEILLYKRVHNHNTSSNTQVNSRELLKVMRSSIHHKSQK